MESRILDPSPKLLTYTLLHFIHPALYFSCSGSRIKGRQCNFQFYSLKKSFPSPENMFSDRSEHRVRQLNYATKNRSPTPGFLPAQPQHKVRLTLLFYNEYSFHYNYYENSNICTTDILKNVLLLLSQILF